jgi:hypothetical protein
MVGCAENEILNILFNVRCCYMQILKQKIHDYGSDNEGI